VPYRTRRESGEWGEETQFVNVVAWRQQAEFAHTYLNKGRQVLVEGRLTVRSFTGQDGVKRTVYEVLAERITFVGPRPAAEGAPGEPAEGAPEEAAAEPEGPDVLGDVG